MKPTNSTSKLINVIFKIKLILAYESNICIVASPTRTFFGFEPTVQMDNMGAMRHLEIEA